MVLCFKTVDQTCTYKLENLFIKLSCWWSMFNLPSLCPALLQNFYSMRYQKITYTTSDKILNLKDVLWYALPKNFWNPLIFKKTSQVHQEWSYRWQITVGLEQKKKGGFWIPVTQLHLLKKISLCMFFITHTLMYCSFRRVIKNWWFSEEILKHIYSRMFRQQYYKDRVCRER